MLERWATDALLIRFLVRGDHRPPVQFAPTSYHLFGRVGRKSSLRLRCGIRFTFAIPTQVIDGG